MMKWRTTTLTGMLLSSELPATSMTCAALHALLDTLSINLTRGEAKAPITGSLNAFVE